MTRTIPLTMLLAACGGAPAWTIDDVDGGMRSFEALPFFQIRQPPPPDEPRVEGPHCVGCTVPLAFFLDDYDASMAGWTFESTDPDVATVIATTDRGDARLQVSFWQEGGTDLEVRDRGGNLVSARTVRGAVPSGLLARTWVDQQVDLGPAEDVGREIAVLANRRATLAVRWLDNDGEPLTGSGALRAQVEGAELLPSPLAAVPDDTDTGDTDDTDPPDTDTDHTDTPGPDTDDTDVVDDADDSGTPQPPERPLLLDVDVFPERHLDLLTLIGGTPRAEPFTVAASAGAFLLADFTVHVVGTEAITAVSLVDPQGLPVAPGARPPEWLLSRVEAEGGLRVLGAGLQWAVDGVALGRPGTGVLLEPAPEWHTISACVTPEGPCAAVDLKAVVGQVIDDDVDPGETFICGGCAQGGAGAAPVALLAGLGALVRRRRRP